MNTSPVAQFRTRYGNLYLKSFQFSSSIVHVAMWTGSIEREVAPLVRIQSACMTSTALGGIMCDCAEQMDLALKLISGHGCGVFIYLDDEGRGMGLHEKVVTIAAMNLGADTVTAYTDRGLEPDMRTYSEVGDILLNLGISGSIRLITNNPKKIDSLEQHGFEVKERVSAEIPPTELTYDYLKAKRDKLGHILTML